MVATFLNYMSVLLKFWLFISSVEKPFIVFVWSQYDGENIDKEQWLSFLPKHSEAKLNIVGGDLFWILVSCVKVKMICVTAL